MMQGTRRTQRMLMRKDLRNTLMKPMRKVLQSTLVKHIQSRRADSRTKRMRRMALNMRKNLPGIPKIQEWIPRKCV